MPQLQVTTRRAEQIWQSPDGQRTIYAVEMDSNGQTARAKTYSKAIATEGFSGEVETYEKAGRDGSETFVKQAQKEGGYGGGRQPKDNSEIKAQMAIKAAVQIGGTFDITNQAAMAKYLVGIENAAKEIFAMVDRVKTGTPPETTEIVGIDTNPSFSSDVEDIFSA